MRRVCLIAFQTHRNPKPSVKPAAAEASWNSATLCPCFQPVFVQRWNWQILKARLPSDATSSVRSTWKLYMHRCSKSWWNNLAIRVMPLLWVCAMVVCARFPLGHRQNGPLVSTWEFP